MSTVPMQNGPVVIIGAGPAGLAAAYELAGKGIQPVVFEKAGTVGGISRTETYKGYHFDMGGHRFFTKMEGINRLWHEMLGDDFLEVSRMSRIYYQGRFFDYPLRPLNALTNLGPAESLMILLSYLKVQVWPNSEEETFEQWVSNRFGRRLFRTFFKSYTEKVWGIPCNQIKSDWAAQRIKGLSLMTAVTNAFFGTQGAKTLINAFHYPLRGPGMMWQHFQQAVESHGGQVLLDSKVVRIRHENGRIESVTCRRGDKPETTIHAGGHFISSIPVTRLVAMLEPKAPDKVLEAAQKLCYRSFINVVLILERKNLFPDQWIYVHSPDVRVGRIANFKNWSIAMVPDPEKTCIGMEYFCNEGDDTWATPDAELMDLAAQELSKLGLAEANDVRDGLVVRQAYAYPVYDAGYGKHMKVIRDYLETISNLQTIGRNGMHRYNNMDHSMQTGILAAQNVMGANHDLWQINDEGEYLEAEKKKDPRQLLAEKVLMHTFARMDKLAFATAVGTVSGLLLFAATLWLVIKGVRLTGMNLHLLSQYFIGYTVTVKGAFIAFGYSFLWGFLFGWLFAYLRNFFFAIYIFWVKKKSELLTLKDFFDHL